MKLLKFHATWCQPCKQMSRTLGEMTIPFPVVEIDIDDNTDAAIEYGIRSVPTMILMDDDNNIITKIVGQRSKAALEEIFQTHTKRQ